MGGAKESMIINEESWTYGLIDFLEKLIEREEFEKDSHMGIAKQIISKGVKSMSDKQELVIKNLVNKYKKKYSCDLCLNDNVTSLLEYIDIADEGICPTCESVKQKYMRE